MTDTTFATPRPVLNLESVSKRIGMSVASKDITLDGKVIGSITKEGEGIHWVFVARLHDIQGRRGCAESRSFSELTKRVQIIVTGRLRDQAPDADWGPLTLDASPGELREIEAGTRRVLRYPYAHRYSRVACPFGRAVVILNMGGARGCKGRIEGTLASVKKVSAAVAHKADPLLDIRYHRASSFAEVTFEIVAPAADASTASP